MLIIEGPDCVGKTVLAKKIVDLVAGSKYGHFGLLPDDWNYYSSYLPYIDSTTVMDRFIMSELAYGSAIRGRCEIHSEIYRQLDARLRLCGSYTVLLYCPRDEDLCRLWNAQHRDQDFKLDQVAAANSVYRTVATQRQYFTDHKERYVPDFDIAVPIFWERFTPDHVVNVISEAWALRRQATLRLRALEMS